MPKLTVRAQHRRWMWCGFMVSALLAVGIVEIHVSFVLAFYLCAWLLLRHIHSVKCPYCGNRLLYNKSLGDFYVWTASIPENCMECGKQID